MAIEGFNYEEFANTLSSQASELVPANFQEFQKNYVVNTVKNFSMLSAEAIYNDDKANFNADQAMLITQIIAEWSFHKSVDVIRAGILPDYWDGIMQKIAFTIFEIAKQAIEKNLPQEEVLKIVEHHVKQAYEKVISELKDRKIIDETTCDRALKQSNIDAMMQEMQQQQAQNNPQYQEQQANSGSSDRRILKLASVALLLKQMDNQEKIDTILNKMNSEDANIVIQYMKTPDLEKKMDENIAIKCIEEIKNYLPEPKFIKPEKVIERFGNIFKRVPKERIDKILAKERANIKEFIKTAYDGEHSGLPPKISNIIAAHLEENAL